MSPFSFLCWSRSGLESVESLKVTCFSAACEKYRTFLGTSILSLARLVRMKEIRVCLKSYLAMIVGRYMWRYLSNYFVQMSPIFLLFIYNYRSIFITYSSFWSLYFSALFFFLHPPSFDIFFIYPSLVRKFYWENATFFFSTLNKHAERDSVLFPTLIDRFKKFQSPNQTFIKTNKQSSLLFSVSFSNRTFFECQLSISLFADLLRQTLQTNTEF